MKGYDGKRKRNGRKKLDRNVAIDGIKMEGGLNAMCALQGRRESFMAETGQS